MRRITIDEVRAACEATGYALKKGAIDRERKYGCPLNVIMISFRDEDEVEAWRLGFQPGYHRGFVDGFDSISQDLRRSLHGDIVDSDPYKTGRNDGTAIRQALLPA